MIVEISNEIKKIINEMPYNKTVKNNAVKIYAALYLMSKRQNKWGYFSVPSEYLKSINVRYFKIIKHFEEKNMIQSYKRPVQDDNDIFNTKYVKYYNVNKGICMKYKFLVPTSGDIVDIDMVTNKEFRWYDLIQNSLLEAGYEDIKISRDTFGRRVHHSGIRDYKKDFKGFYTIDSISSQPRLLYLDMKEKGLYDEKFFDIFENDKDFYLETQYELNLQERQEAKDLFMYWVNSSGYVPNYNIHNLYPVVSKYIKDRKKGSYKDMASYLQRLESKIWIDDILNNLPVEWALPIHDSVIVKKEDADDVLDFCKMKYPELRFKKELI